MKDPSVVTRFASPLALLVVMNAVMVGFGQHASPPVLKNVFVKAQSPVAVVLTPLFRQALRNVIPPPETTELVQEREGSDRLVYIVFRMPDGAPSSCTLEHQDPEDREFGAESRFRMEIVKDRKTTLVATDAAIPAKWVAVHPSVDIAKFGITNLKGPAVLGAFTPEEIEQSGFVVLYRIKHWHDGLEVIHANFGACGGHTHKSMTWGVIPADSN